MKYIVNPSKLKGGVDIPGSKSHTIRALFFAALAEGESLISRPLESADTRSAMGVCKGLGAEIIETAEKWTVRGTGGRIRRPDAPLDVDNSGTTMRIGLGAAALCTESGITLTGDEQVRRRPIGGLVEALNNLGAEVICQNNNGCPPVRVMRPMRGGKTPLRSPSSQFLTSLLINTPLAPEDSEIDVLELNEKPYIEMTLWWLERLGIKYSRRGMDWFGVPGRQKYKAFNLAIPADFSSATFFAVAAAVTGSEITLRGLDLTDTQGDKAVLDYLEAMGANVRVEADGVKIAGGNLEGVEIDMNSTPDALPAMAVAGCFARGETRLVNVPQARMKETDRIAVMAAELKKMGAEVKELPDGLVLKESELRGASLHGRADHRIVMALAVAGLAAKGSTVIDTAESAAVTFPDFDSLMRSLGADISSTQD